MGDTLIMLSECELNTQNMFMVSRCVSPKMTSMVLGDSTLEST